MGSIKSLLKRLDLAQVSYRYSNEGLSEKDFMILDRAKLKEVHSYMIKNSFMDTVDYMMMDEVSPLDKIAHWEMVVLLISSEGYSMNSSTVMIKNELLSRYWTVCTRLVAIRKCVKPMKWAWLNGRDSFKFSAGVENTLMSMRSVKTHSRTRPRLDLGIDRVEIGTAGDAQIRSGIEAKIVSVIKHVNKCTLLDAIENMSMGLYQSMNNYGDSDSNKDSSESSDNEQSEVTSKATTSTVDVSGI